MSATITQKTVRVATWEYHTPEGVRRRAYFNEVIDVGADELERGTKEGAFDQPPAGVYTTPFIATGVVAENLKELLADFRPLAPEPVGDDGAAVLHHDIRPPVVAPAPEVAADVAKVDDVPKKPLKAAPKPEWEDYAVKVTASTDNPLSEADAKALHKSDLIELYG